MDFQLSEEHRLIQETRAASRRRNRAARRRDRRVQEYPHDVFAAFKETASPV